MFNFIQISLAILMFLKHFLVSGKKQRRLWNCKHCLCSVRLSMHVMFNLEKRWFPRLSVNVFTCLTLKNVVLTACGSLSTCEVRPKLCSLARLWSVVSSLLSFSQFWLSQLPSFSQVHTPVLLPWSHSWGILFLVRSTCLFLFPFTN